MPDWLVYLKIILPQILPLAKKGWITYAIGTVKRISIASTISVSERHQAGHRRHQRPLSCSSASSSPSTC